MSNQVRRYFSMWKKWVRLAYKKNELDALSIKISDSSKGQQPINQWGRCKSVQCIEKIYYYVNKWKGINEEYYKTMSADNM
ncbi:14333_t:CDS:2 [Gigaspora margarita]|uniref:14333_t:CDS:1 n=1 Tax=Gigaspora margarita TaxID=4874 RepID=A0ABN7UW83_GIGMA|nr:14333_t:CDS:2 [Gigaspora margarita]